MVYPECSYVALSVQGCCTIGARLLHFSATVFSMYLQSVFLKKNNKRFEVKSPMEQCFWSIFRAAGETEEGRYMTTSEIFMEMKSVYGSIFKINSLAVFGKCLSGIPELIRRKPRRGTEYYVVRA